MTKTELTALLDRLKLHPSRRLGQNFLIDDNMLDAIVRDAAPRSGDVVLEIGPGTGVLTAKLLKQGCRVIAVEYDRRLVEFIHERFAEQAVSGQFRLIEGDACRVDFHEILGRRPFRCISNLPYSIGTPVVMRLAALENRPLDMTLLLQTEAAERFAAAPGTKSYGAASVVLQHLYSVKLLRHVPKTVFFPEPEVGSALVKLATREIANFATPLPATDEVIDGIRKLFTQRRKRLHKVAASHYPAAAVDQTFIDLNLAQDTRAETLEPDTLWSFVERILTARD